MNALELADFLESETQTTAKINAFIKKSAATMLRQQQIKIEALKAHPVKELTDEEIAEFKQVASYYGIECSLLTGIQEFIRAILRKTQEK